MFVALVLAVDAVAGEVGVAVVGLGMRMRMMGRWIRCVRGGNLRGGLCRRLRREFRRSWIGVCFGGIGLVERGLVLGVMGWDDEREVKDLEGIFEEGLLAVVW